jgi:dephospho-CoA kinase
MKKIGLTGSIGAGKSAVTHILRAHGVAVHDADAAVHDIYKWPEMTVWLAYHFPQVMATGGVDRALLAEIIFKDPDMRKKLEAILHPAVAQHRGQFVATARAGGAPMVVCDIPLLYETGAEKEFDEIWVVAAPDAVRMARALDRPQMTAEKFQSINAAQMPQAEKILRADVVIENDGTLDALREKVLALLQQGA